MLNGLYLIAGALSGVFLPANKYYESIEELPIFNWWNLQSTLDFSYLLKTKKKINLIQKIILSRQRKKLYADYIDRFGFGDKYMEMIEKKQRIAIMRIERALENDKSKETFIEIEEEELLNMVIEAQGESLNLYESSAIIGRVLGFRIDVKECTVVEFFHYMKTAQKIQKQNQSSLNTAKDGEE